MATGCFELVPEWNVRTAYRMSFLLGQYRKVKFWIIYAASGAALIPIILSQ
jgi:hypothetical protein